MKSTPTLMTVFALAGLLASSLYAGGDGEGREHKKRKGHRGKSMMHMLDMDQDGQVSKDEMMKHFSDVDANGDGLLSDEEFKAHRESKRGGMEKKRESMKDMSPEERFSKMDKNGNGSLEADEFPNKKIFEKIDADSSGGLSQEELKAFKGNMKERGSRRKGEGKKKTEGSDPVTF